MLKLLPKFTRKKWILKKQKVKQVAKLLLKLLKFKTDEKQMAVKH